MPFSGRRCFGFFVQDHLKEAPRRGVGLEHTGMSVSFDVPESRRARPGYLRLDARYGRRNEKLCTQPVWL
ncbi:MAG: hypothetical protein IJS01_04250 [Lentisphaeria bacterium]|nr:hypothetical protein [Lentisphaeria bacterium]